MRALRFLGGASEGTTSFPFSVWPRPPFMQQLREPATHPLTHPASLFPPRSLVATRGRGEEAARETSGMGLHLQMEIGSEIRFHHASPPPIPSHPLSPSSHNPD